MFNRLMGRASAETSSRMVKPYLIEGEQILKSFKVWRDEIVVTNFGIYDIDARGITGRKKVISFTPTKFIEGFRFTSASTLDFSVNIDIYVRKHFGALGKNVGFISIKARKQDQEVVQEMTKTIKDMILGNEIQTDPDLKE